MGTSQDKKPLGISLEIEIPRDQQSKGEISKKNLEKRDSRRLLQVVSGRTPAWRPA